MRGRSFSLTPARRLVCDLLHFARLVPSVPVQRRMHLADLVTARRAVTPRPSWVALFTRALDRVAGDFPELRRAYLSWPWPRLYESAESVAMIAVERSVAGEASVLLGRVRSPARLSLAELDDRIEQWRTQPIEAIPAFQRALRLAQWPTVIRRTLWHLGLNVFGSQRLRHFGTFLVTVYSALGAESLHPLSPLTLTLNYGVIGADGQVDVRLIYDHRVMDGALVARALARLEEILLTETLAELQALTRRPGVAA